MKDWRQWLTHERMYWRENRRQEPSLWSDTSSEGMIATAHYLATAAGLEIMEQGGNAIDAAVAASLALGVCEPAGSGLGGMAMMVIHQAAGRTVALEGPCRAPRRATPEAVAAAPRRRGYRAVAVPTYVAVLDYALRHYGTLGLARVIAPAIRLAEDGYPLTRLQHTLTRHYRKGLARGTAASLFLDADRQPLPPGTWFRQPALARTLRRLSEAGFEDFYRGDMARLMCQDMIRHDGFIREDDLADIPWPTETLPLSGRFKEWDLYTLPPPGGGLALLQMLNLWSVIAPDDLDPDSPEGVVLLATVIRRARSDRRRYYRNQAAGLTDPIPDRLDAAYNRTAAAEIQAALGGAGETSHLSVMDRQGNVVALTQSLERCFGAKVATEELGFLYNGYMKAFNLRKPQHPHYLRPGAKARSNAAPTIVLEDGRPRAALGSTGSERLASGIFEVLVRLRRSTPFQAVRAPRLHCTPEGEVRLEAGRFHPDCLAALERQGFRLAHYDAYSFKVGGLQLVTGDGETFCGVAEPRRDGAAAGPSGSCGRCSTRRA